MLINEPYFEKCYWLFIYIYISLYRLFGILSMSVFNSIWAEEKQFQ